MKAISAIVLGGSNTVMRPGYITELPSAYSKHGISLTIQGNLAVGNTLSLMGLITLKENEDSLKSVDALFIEYTLNDTDIFRLYKGTFEDLRKWQAAVEGTIRYARTINPFLKIIPIILAAKDGIHRTMINPLHSGLCYLSDYYNLCVADVNMSFTKRFGKAYGDLTGVYQDFGHYSRPIFTSLAAEYIAEATHSYLLANRVEFILLSSISDRCYEIMGSVRADLVIGLRSDKFKNYLYDETTFDLATGDIELTIENGAPVAIKYVCTEDISRLYVFNNDKWYLCNTLQPGMEEPKYKFLVSMAYLEDLKHSSGMNKYKLSCHCPDGVDAIPLHQHVGKPPTRPEMRLPISNIAYTGTLKSVKVIGHVVEPARREVTS